jgi:hypothetical protein
MALNETTVNTEATDASTETSQEIVAKTYTQEEFDRHMAGLKNSISKKYEKQFSELGDIDELRALKQQAEQKRVEEATKRGEFEKVLQDLAAKKDAEISRRDAVIREYKVDTPLVSAAAKFRSVNPEQVKALLKSNVRLSNDGDVEVLDNNGQVRYNDAGQAYQVEDLVKEWLDQNPHFVQPTPSTSNTKSNISGNTANSKVDVSKLDMSNPQHRELYKQYRKQNGIA